MVFSQRYKDLLTSENGAVSLIKCGDISSESKMDLYNTLLDFNEPKRIKNSRYDNQFHTANAFNLAACRLNEIAKKEVVNEYMIQLGHIKDSPLLASIRTDYLFDLIELQYNELSKREKPKYQSEVNQVLNANDIPWLLCDGIMIKIDSRQFECDLKNKSLDKMKELKDCEPKFQAPYDELLRALEFYTKENYPEAISNAEKSYESVLKVICGEQAEATNQLITQYKSKFLNDLPSTMKKDGFCTNVMMSLPYIRNNSSSVHGAGATPVESSKALANLAINLAASLNTFLIEEYRSGLSHSSK